MTRGTDRHRRGELDERSIEVRVASVDRRLRPGGAVDRCTEQASTRTAFTVLPDVLFGEHGILFVEGLLRGLGAQQFAAMWSMASDIERPEIDFTVSVREVTGGVVVIVALPDGGTPDEVALVAIYLPEPFAHEVQRTAGKHLELARGDMASVGVRMLFLEHVDFGMALGEFRDGARVHHRFCTEVSIDAFVDALTAIIASGA